MELKEIHLLLTYRCTYECDHCFVWSSPNANGTMKLAQVKRYIDQAAKFDSINKIYLEGGEPFMYYPIMLESAKYVRKQGLEVGVVSNGYYGTSVEDAVEWLKPFKELIAPPLFISDDGYHSSDSEERTPADYAVAAAEHLGMNAATICIDPPSVIEDERNPGEAIVGGGVRFRGRAVEKVGSDELLKQSWDSFTSCPDEDFDKIGRLHLDANGNLYPCQGVVVGNMESNSLAEIVEQYDPQAHPIIAPICSGGPAELVRKYNLPLKDQYVDACHLCYLARKMLRSQYPEHLAPPQVYGE